MILFTLAVLITQDEVPLVLPKVAPPASGMEIRAERDLRAPDRPIAERSLHVGAKVLGLLQSGGLQGGTVGAVEVGYRLPVLNKRLGLMVEPAFGGLWGRAGSSSLWLSLPVGVTFHQQLGPGLLRAVALASLEWVAARTVVESDPVSDRFWTLGLTAGAGYVIPLGPGGVTVEARYRLLPYVLAEQKTLGHGVTLSVGYSFFLL